MNGLLVDTIGMAGAVLTTACWLPQAIKIVRSRNSAAISLTGTLAFTIGDRVLADLWPGTEGLAADHFERGHPGIDVGDRRAEAAARVRRDWLSWPDLFRRVFCARGNKHK